MRKVLSLPLRTETKSERFILKSFKIGLRDSVSVFHRGEFGISRLVSMEIGADGRITMLRFSDGPTVSSSDKEEIVHVPRVPL